MGNIDSTRQPKRHMTGFLHISRRWWILAAKIAIAVAVCVAVSQSFRDALATLAERSWHLEFVWLVVAGALYLAGMVPMARYWWRTLVSFGERPEWWATLRAYVVGHLGKYVPGKALVIVIRVGMLRPRASSVRLAVASVLVETLTLMAVGAGIGAIASGLVLNLDWRVTAAAMAVAIAVGIPMLPPVARRLAGSAALDLRRMVVEGGQQPSAGSSPHSLNFRLLGVGAIGAMMCWTLWGLSLWATLRAIGADGIEPLHDLPMLVAAVSLSVVAGFVSMLPGGLVVRDALLLELLSPACGAADALLAAALLRLAWLVSELGLCGILELWPRRERASKRAAE
jgi:uncharacterized membrane protein YbhN (UPF0104 family)